MHYLARTRLEGVPTTNNLAESVHRGWQHAGGKQMNLVEAIIFEFAEMKITAAKVRGM